MTTRKIGVIAPIILVVLLAALFAYAAPQTPGGGFGGGGAQSLRDWDGFRFLGMGTPPDCYC
ncbi:MAG: hypothetical protein ACUVX8_05695 [Candidatus Zipacnadales bacterium]